MKGYGARIAYLLATTVLTVVAGATAFERNAYAQAASQKHYSFNIPSKPVREGLNDIGRLTGLSVVFNETAAASVRGRPVSGTMTREQALTTLLSGTGLGYRFTNANTVTITDPIAAAHDAPVAADGSLVLDTIEVTAGEGRSASADANYETAGTVNYISQEDIRRFRGSSPGDFLKGTPGVLSGDNRNSGAVDINIRGVQGFNRVPVVIDGSQQANVVYRGYSGVASRNYFDPDMIGGVEIEKGPTSGVDGVGAVGGVARMRTISVDDILSGDKTWGMRVRGGFSTNTANPPPFGTPGGSRPETDPERLDRPFFLEPTGWNGSIAAAHSSENVDLLAAYSKRRTGNYFSGENGKEPDLTGLNLYRMGEEVLNTSNETESVLLKGKLRFGDGHSLELGYMGYWSEFGEMMPSQIIRFDQAQQSDPSHVQVDTYTGRYNWKPDDNDLIDLKADLWHTNTDTTIITPVQDFWQEGQPWVRQGFFDISKRTGFNISNTSRFDGSLGSFALEYGGSYTYETLAPPDDIPARMAKYNIAEILGDSRDGWRREASAFAATEWKPLDWLKLNGGLRYTDTKSYDNKAVTEWVGGVPMPPAHNEEKSDGFAPILAATVEPVKGLQFYGRYAEAIRAPSLFESTNGWSAIVKPSVDLRPEHAHNWEFGVNVLRDDVFVAGDKLRVKLSYFDNHITDYMSRTNQTASDGSTEVGTVLRNMRYADFKGYEASLSYDPGMMFGEISGVYYDSIEYCTYYPDTCSSGGAPSGYVQLHVPPEFSASATLGFRLLEEKLTLGGRVTYMGERAATDYGFPSGGISSAVTWEPYTLVDVFASYKFNEKFQLDAAIDNLTDQYYMDSLNLGLMPSPGRTFRASLTAKF